MINLKFFYFISLFFGLDDRAKIVQIIQIRQSSEEDCQNNKTLKKLKEFYSLNKVSLEQKEKQNSEVIRLFAQSLMQK